MPDDPYPDEPHPEPAAPELPAQPGDGGLPVSVWPEEDSPTPFPQPRRDDAELLTQPAPRSERRELAGDEVDEADDLPDVELPPELVASLEEGEATAAPSPEPGSAALSPAPDAPAPDAGLEGGEDEGGDGEGDEDAPEIPDDALDRLVAQDAAPAETTAFGRWRSERRPDLRPRVEELEAELAARTDELQRLQAEFQNYRRRISRERSSDTQRTTAAVLSELLPVLDDLARVQHHGDLHGPLVGIMDSLIATTTRLGLERFGEVGEPFDPEIHEALQHTYSLDVTETVCAEVYMSGYRHEGRLLRPARVHVAEPDPDLPVGDEDDEA